VTTKSLKTSSEEGSTSSEGTEELKALPPGDILDVVVKLRKLAAMNDTVSHTLFASFEEIGSADLEQKAETCRRTAALMAKRIYDLLSSLEKTPTYQGYRQKVLKCRSESSKTLTKK
jgi:hypothetical protein